MNSNKPVDTHTLGFGAMAFPFGSVTEKYKARAALEIAKRQADLELKKLVAAYGPQAETATTYHFKQSELVKLDRILTDDDFINSRLSVDLNELGRLQDSIDLEGLKSAVIVVESAAPGYYHLRAGFRRTQAVRRLGWTMIPAFVLPANTPRLVEYWINILENTSPDKLTTYELAATAQRMRDNFGVSHEDFARRTSHQTTFVSNLLGCIDRLPPEVLNSWKNGDPIPFSIYHKLSLMSPTEAIKNLWMWKRNHRIEDAGTLAEKALAKRRMRQRHVDKLLTVPGIERTQRLMMAVRTSKLSAETKTVCVEMIEYIQGCRKRVSGVISDGARRPPEPQEDLNDSFEQEMLSRFREMDDKVSDTSDNSSPPQPHIETVDNEQS